MCPTHGAPSRSAEPVQQAQDCIVIHTEGPGLTEITDRVAAFVEASGIASGLLTLLVQHTSASLIITENADPDVLSDLSDALARLAPEDPTLYRHSAEGPDDMPAHIRSVLTHSSLGIPVLEGHLTLGTWQGIFLVEHRRDPHRRMIAAHILGE